MEARSENCPPGLWGWDSQGGGQVASRLCTQSRAGLAGYPPEVSVGSAISLESFPRPNNQFKPSLTTSVGRVYSEVHRSPKGARESPGVELHFLSQTSAVRC